HGYDRLCQEEAQLMKRSKKLIILIAVLVVLVIAVTIISKLTEPEPYTPTETIDLGVESGTITNLAWTYNGEEVALSLDGDTWAYDGDPTFPLDQSYPEAMLTAVEELSASQALESAQALSEYGLDTPALSIT